MIRILSALRRVRGWASLRPAIGALLIALAGVELFLSSQLDLGHIHVQLGIEGLQSTILPLALVVLGALIAVMPQHRVFYGIISLALSIYTIVGLNLGGFLIGMLLGTVGSVLAVSWMPKARRGKGAEVAAGADAGDPATAGRTASEGTSPKLGTSTS